MDSSSDDDQPLSKRPRIAPISNPSEHPQALPQPSVPAPPQPQNTTPTIDPPQAPLTSAPVPAPETSAHQSSTPPSAHPPYDQPVSILSLVNTAQPELPAIPQSLSQSHEAPQGPADDHTNGIVNSHNSPFLLLISILDIAHQQSLVPMNVDVTPGKHIILGYDYPN